VADSETSNCVFHAGVCDLSLTLILSLSGISQVLFNIIGLDDISESVRVCGAMKN